MGETYYRASWIFHLGDLARLLRLQERQQIDEFRPGETLVQTLRHQRNIGGLHGNDLFSRDSHFGVRSRNQGHGIGRIITANAGEGLRFGFDIVDLESWNETGAGKDDGFQNVVAGADGADAGEIGANVAGGSR